MTVGRNVRAELVRANRSQLWLAKHLTVSQTGVSNRLAGRTPIDINELVQIAELLDVSIDRLLDGVRVEAVSA